MNIMDRMAEAIVQKQNPRRWGWTRGWNTFRKASSSPARTFKKRRRGDLRFQPRPDRRRSGHCSGGQGPGRVLRNVRRGGDDRLQAHPGIRKAGGADRHRGRQARGYRLHRRSLRPRLPFRHAGGEKRCPRLNRISLPSTLPGNGRHQALRGCLRPTRQGDLRPRQDQQPLRRRISGPDRKRQAGLRARGQNDRQMGRRTDRKKRLFRHRRGRRGDLPRTGRSARALLPNTFFLIPGYGAQGGTAGQIAKSFDGKGGGAVVNASRSIMCAYKKQPGVPFAAAARNEALRMKEDLLAALGGRIG